MFLLNVWSITYRRLKAIDDNFVTTFVWSHYENDTWSIYLMFSGEESLVLEAGLRC